MTAAPAPSAAGLLDIARETVAGLTYCFLITLADDGAPSARVIQPRAITDEWTVDFATTRSSRKGREIARQPRVTLAYQNDAERAYVCLAGNAVLVDDLALKRARWRPEAERWYPGGPDNPDFVFVRVHVDRIELWSGARAVMPEPKGQRAAVLVRESGGWRAGTT